ncbi:MAG TPA: hypothetical protein VGF07_08755 [Stellaceae bacterium]|jgi:hypothetical protein
MKVQEAVAAAREQILEFFSDEKIANLGLEEIELDEATNSWLITFGFSRPWDRLTGPLAAIENASRELRPWQRDYKVVRIDNRTGKFISIKNRETTYAG